MGDEENTTQATTEPVVSENTTVVNSVAELQKDLMQQMPKAEPHVETKKVKFEGTDKRGTKFNPAKHITDENGKPLFTKSGNFKRIYDTAKHRNSKSRLERSKIQTEVEYTEEREHTSPEEFKSSAAVYVDLFTGSLEGSIGPEMKPENQERQQMIDAVGAYLQEVDGPVASPFWRVIHAVGMYLMRRLEILMSKLDPLLNKFQGKKPEKPVEKKEEPPVDGEKPDQDINNPMSFTPMA